MAGEAFRSYRARGGTKTGNPPDFFVGAHAVIEGPSVLTGDPRRYRAYLPKID